MKKILLSTVALTFVLSGCVATDPYTGQTTLTNTGGGSAIGAALGGFVGAVAAEEGDRGRSALRGALAGGVVGAGVGAYMDIRSANCASRWKEPVSVSSVRVMICA